MSEHAATSAARPRIAVLVSGAGRSLENLAEQVRDGTLPVQIELVLSNRPDAPALARAERLGLASRVIDHRQYADAAAFSAAVFAELDAHGCELAVLAGFLRLLVLPAHWRGHVLNIHPSLLPAFGGKGYYGDRVHAAVLESGALFSGCTVHYVTDEYDRGPLFLQRSIPVQVGETVASLGARVFEQEKIALPEAIRRHFRQARAHGTSSHSVSPGSVAP